MRRLLLCSCLACALILVAAFAPAICPYDPNRQDLSQSLRPPSAEHLMGTDRYGRDMFSRVIVGARVSVFAALSLVAITTAFGTATGAACAFCGGPVDALIMRFSDVCLAFPGLVFALFVAAVIRGGVFGAVAAIAVVSWPKYARLSRSLILSLRDRDFILAARMAGLSRFQIAVRHAIPNVIGEIVVTAALDVGTMMMELAGLSFLGLGAQPPTPEWGSMMSTGRSMFQTYPWVVLAPGTAIFASVVTFNMLGDAVRDHFDRRQADLEAGV